MNKHQFKPFDHVLVRDSERSNWKIDIYSHYEKESDFPHICIGSCYAQCLPYNENTVHLAGTNQPYEQKEWYVCDSTSTFTEQLTAKEFSEFINKAVINNKDITNFSVKYIANENNTQCRTKLSEQIVSEIPSKAINEFD